MKAKRYLAQHPLLLPGNMRDGRKDLLREHVGLDGVEDIDEDDEDGEVLDPAPLDHLPEAGRVLDGVDGVVNVCLQHKLVQPGPPAPHPVLILQPQRHVPSPVVTKHPTHVQRLVRW